MLVSKLAEGLSGSEIIKIAGQVNEKIKNGDKIYNLTIGDFDSKIFPIPQSLKESIIDYIKNDETNYPPADGVMTLRNSVKDFIKRRFDLDYTTNEILIGGGARPMIYSLYRTILDDGDKVIFSVPSWNNNHYSYLTSTQQIVIETKPENNFMISASDIKPHISEVSLIALCSPQNPTGTTLTENSLREICNLVIEENKKRVDRKPVYLMYDQIYSELCFGVEHVNPVSLVPEMKQWTIFVDGISKSLSATGIRVGWSFGPQSVISKMKSIVGHMGAWAPKAEQLATSDFLSSETYDEFLDSQKNKIMKKLDSLYNHFLAMKSDGYSVDVIKPEGAIYLSVKLDVIGSKTKSGSILENTSDICSFFIESGVAIVPFSAFGSSISLPWFRISIGTLRDEEIESLIDCFKIGLDSLQPAFSPEVN